MRSPKTHISRRHDTASRIERTCAPLRRLLGRPHVKAGFAVLVLVAAAWIVRRELRDVRFAAVVAALRATPKWAIALSAAFTVLSYGSLAVVEWFALRLVGRPQRFRSMVSTSFGANALSIVLGFGLASGALVRLRLYRYAKLSAARTAELVALLTGATVISGVIAAGLSTLLAAPRVAAALSWPKAAVTLAGLGLLTPASWWFLLFRKGSARRKRVVGAADRAVVLAANLGDWLFSGLALFILSSRDPASLPEFFVVFTFGSLVASIFGTPGGLGVLDAVLLGLHTRLRTHETAAALILYRAIYLVGPFLLTLCVLGLLELRRWAYPRDRPPSSA